MNIDFAKLCGKHGAIYEAYYKQMDSKGTGTIEAMVAAKFLKKSGLSDVVLSRIWDLSDPDGNGYLDRPGFFVALKLVSLAQAGHVYNMNNIYMDMEKPPKVGDLPKITTPRPQSVSGVGQGSWAISVIDRLKYEQLFESLKPSNGMLTGNKVKGVLMDSKLPLETLGKIWDLSDQDKDGNLDKEEFIVAMHLVYQILEKRTVPDVLPPELRKPNISGGGVPPRPVPPMADSVPSRIASNKTFADNDFVANFPKDIPPPPVVQLPVAMPLMARVPPVGGPSITAAAITSDPLIPIGAPSSVTANVEWEIKEGDLKRYEVMFRDADRDKDGLVSGVEVKNIFLQSGVPQKILAHIWALCDTNQSGKLNLEQFALAMWFVERKQKGIDPPQVLTASMVPPSMRGIVSGVDLQPQETKPTYTNPELEMIVKEIEELAKERRALETETAQKEADIRIKWGEVRTLQNELDTLSATLKQLENQRGEAQKRLSDLKSQVNKVREQCQKQEETIAEQEEELQAKRSEIQKLKDEESALQKQYDDDQRELQKLTNHLQNTQLQISSIRSEITELLETQRQMTDAFLLCKETVETGNAGQVSEYLLKIEPDFHNARKILEKEVEEMKADPFNEMNNVAMKSTNGFDADPFGDKINQSGRSGFDDRFNTISGFDAFGSSEEFVVDSATTITNNPSNTNEDVVDRFDSDPFAALHAPTGQGQVLSPNIQAKSGPPPRPESPSPALPPKKSKQPPPRPAPPRPLQVAARPGQTVSSEVESIASNNPSGGFADFSDFHKASTTPTPLSSLCNLKAINISSTTRSKTATSVSASASTSTAINEMAMNRSNDNLIKSAKLIDNDNEDKSTSHISNTFAFSEMNANIFTPLTVDINSSNNNSIITTNSTVLNGPIDFKDDPFKDYRYEDPFNIKDPFDDDNNENCTADPEIIFKSDISYVEVGQTSEVVNVNNEFHVNHNSREQMLKPALNVEQNNAKVFNVNDFDAFSMKSPMSLNFKNTGSDNSLFKCGDPFFDNIKSHSHENVHFLNRESTSSRSPGSYPNVNKTTSYASGVENAMKNTTHNNAIGTNSNDNCFEDDFLQLSLSNFTQNTTSNATECDVNVISSNSTKNNNTNNNNNNNNNNNINNNNNNNNSKNSINNANDKENFINEMNLKKVVHPHPVVFTKNEIVPKKILNTCKTTKNVKRVSSNNSRLDKFADDYSKPDSFEIDLQEAIKRSMLDQ